MAACKVAVLVAVAAMVLAVSTLTSAGTQCSSSFVACLSMLSVTANFTTQSWPYAGYAVDFQLNNTRIRGQFNLYSQEQGTTETYILDVLTLNTLTYSVVTVGGKDYCTKVAAPVPVPPICTPSDPSMTISVTVGGEDPMAGTGFYAEAGGIQAGVIVSNTDFTPIGFSTYGTININGVNSTYMSSGMFFNVVNMKPSADQWVIPSSCQQEGTPVLSPEHEQIIQQIRFF